MPEDLGKQEPVNQDQAQRADDMIVFREVHKWFGDFHVLKGVNINIGRGEVVVVFGPSGSGKSTFIRTINRLEEHQRGQIVVDGVELTHDIRHIEAVRRDVGMVFQSFNLFPHLTVMQNITLAPVKVRKSPRKEAELASMELLERVGIPEQAQKYPAELSGGQQQRVAIARAVITRPKLLLADEPTGNVDDRIAVRLLHLFDELNKLGTTVVVATHNEALVGKLGRDCLWLDGGRLARTPPVPSHGTAAQGTAA